MRILTVFGTRPEAIKMALLVRKLNADTRFVHKVCVTGQHREMLDQVLSLFSITPDYDLHIMQADQSLHHIASEVLVQIKKVLEEFKPDLVLVHGDTTTAFATALAAFYSDIAIGHVEAGMRTGNLYYPFPEEANRLVIDRLATYHFAPTNLNVRNLLKEGLRKKYILKTGNTVIDSLLYIAEKTKEPTEELKRSPIAGLLKGNRKMLLVTGHRRENFGKGLVEICAALAELSKKYPDVDIVYPVHLNPHVRKPVFQLLEDTKRVYLIDPLTYPSFVYLMKRAHIILTDSGGIQEEAPSLHKPVLVMRYETERPEALRAGTVQLVGAHTKNIVRGVSKLLDDEKLYKKMSRAKNPYGDGRATERIMKFLRTLKLEHRKAYE